MDKENSAQLYREQSGEKDDLEISPAAVLDSRHQGTVTDDVFGELAENGPNYRNVGWWGTVALMMKTQIGLGVLSIPRVFHILGMIPGVICLLSIAGITTWSNYMVGAFKLKHRSVYGIDDAGGLMFGRVGREFFGLVFILYLVCVCGAGMLGISIGLNAISDHGTCTAVFVAVAAGVALCLSTVQTLGRLTWPVWIGLVTLIVAILTVTIAVGIQDRPADAPTEGPYVSDYKLTNRPSLVDALGACSSLVFAYAGTPAFFPIVSEMRDPRYYTRSLLICQALVTLTYTVIGIVVYYYAGSYVASPALGSAGPLIKKVAYGFALPGLLVTTTLVIHLPAKYVFIRIFRGSHHLTHNTVKHWVTWVLCCCATGLVAYLIASSIPVFGGLVSLVGALFGTLCSFQPMGCMWLYDHWKDFRAQRTTRLTLMVLWCIFVIASGTFLMIGGSYGAIVGIIRTYQASGGSAAFSCADNSKSHH